MPVIKFDLDLHIPTINYDMNTTKGKYPHLQDIEFAKVKSDKVTVLIGTSHADLLVHREYRTGKNGEPVAVKLNINCNC